MSKLDLTKPYQTRDGHKAGVIIGPDGGLYGWCEDEDGKIDPEEWNADGTFKSPCSTGESDLVNVPEKRTVKLFINVYEDRTAVHFSATDAAACATDRRIAYVEQDLTYTVGEGLEP